MSNANATNATNASGNNNTFTDWNKWFESRPSSTPIDQKLQEQLFLAFKGDLPAADCKKQLLDYQDTTFLFKETFGQKLNIFHHTKSTGGTAYDSTVNTGFIQEGTAKEEAHAMTPDIDTLCEVSTETAVGVPTIASILGANTVEAVNVLVNGATTTYHPRNFIPITPFLCQDVSDSIGQSQGDGTLLLLKIINSIKNFDTMHTDEVEYVDKARQKCKDLL